MDASDLELGRLFTTNGLDAWKLESYFAMPSCTLKNLETGQTMTFGMGGITAGNFKRLVPSPGDTGSHG